MSASASPKQEKSAAFSVAIIGAGFAGICMGIRLKQAGIDDFVIYGRANELGGTWRDNTYPGAPDFTGALSRAKAQMMKARPVLIVCTVPLLGRGSANQNARPAPNAIDDAVSLDEGLHLEEVAELLPEWHTPVRVLHGELDVGNSIDRNRHVSSSLFSGFTRPG